MRPRAFSISVLMIAALAWSGAAADERNDFGWTALSDGAIVLFRHSSAPGIGDPPHMKLGNCATQRNLDQAGRDQARRIGEAFRARKIMIGAVLASEWCRTTETAELAFPGLVRPEPVFNSFFNEADAKASERTKAAQRFLTDWRGPGVLVVSTHQVNITALTGRVPGSGEGIVLARRGDALVVVGAVTP